MFTGAKPLINDRGTGHFAVFLAQSLVMFGRAKQFEKMLYTKYISNFAPQKSLEVWITCHTFVAVNNSQTQ